MKSTKFQNYIWKRIKKISIKKSNNKSAINNLIDDWKFYENKTEEIKKFITIKFLFYFYVFANVYFWIKSDKVFLYKTFDYKIKFKSDIKFENHFLLYQMFFKHLRFLKKYFTKNFVSRLYFENLFFLRFFSIFRQKKSKKRRKFYIDFSQIQRYYKNRSIFIIFYRRNIRQIQRNRSFYQNGRSSNFQ